MGNWKDSKEYKEIETNLLRCENKLDEIFTDRVELFQKLNVDDIDKQKHIVDLINNVVWERDVSLRKTKHTLELSFTPELKEMLNEKE